MRAFRRVTATAAPLVRPNIDTDVLIAGHQITHLAKFGFGRGLFADWRFENPQADDAERREIPDFVLNREPYRRAQVLLAGVNFGCGSSREAAVWALRDFGFRAVLAPSFGPILYANCFKNGVLPVELPQAVVDALAAEVESTQGAALLTVDLERCEVTSPGGIEARFTLAENLRQMLLRGVDQIDATLALGVHIDAFEARDRLRRPWIHARTGAAVN